MVNIKWINIFLKASTCINGSIFWGRGVRGDRRQETEEERCETRDERKETGYGTRDYRERRRCEGATRKNPPPPPLNDGNS